MNRKSKSFKAFSLVELSVVILIIGIVMAGIVSANRLVQKFRLNGARSLTATSPVNGIDGLIVWFETTSENSFDDAEETDGGKITNWYSSNPQAIQQPVLTQATVSKQPTYVGKGQAGLPAVRFYSTDSAPQTMSTTTDVVDILNNPSFTIFFISSSDNQHVSAITTIFQIGTNTGFCDGFNLAHWSTAGMMALRFSGGAQTFTPIALSDHEGIFEIVRDSVAGLTSAQTGTTTYFNGVQKTLSARTNGDCEPLFDSAPLTLAPDTPASSVTTSMDFSEIIIFNRVLKADERSDIRDYLKKKWKLLY